MSNVPVNPNGHSVSFPTSEAEAEQMLLASFDNDPEKIRIAAKESYEKMIKLANSIDGGNTPIEPIVENTIEDVKEAKESKELKQDPIPERVAKQPTIISPPGYLETPEGLYTWSPDIWGGRPLHGVPDRVIEREGRPIMIVFIIVAPAFGRNRNGRVVSLPEGARVVVYASISWAPVIPLAKGPEGRPVLWAAPTTVDDITGKIRIAEPGEKLHTYETGDAGKEYGLSIMYDPDPKDSTKPRLISLETLRGVGG